MKRSMKLICSILFAANDGAISLAGNYLFDKSCVELFETTFSYSDINHHIKLLSQGGLLKVVDVCENGENDCLINGLTWKGYEFISNAQSLDRALRVVGRLNRILGINCYSFDTLVYELEYPKSVNAIPGEPHNIPKQDDTELSPLAKKILASITDTYPFEAFKVEKLYLDCKSFDKTIYYIETSMKMNISPFVVPKIIKGVDKL